MAVYVFIPSEECPDSVFRVSFIF